MRVPAVVEQDLKQAAQLMQSKAVLWHLHIYAAPLPSPCWQRSSSEAFATLAPLKVIFVPLLVEPPLPVWHG
jgi:hypothetical protein